jgi:hypothetical protein
MADLSGLLAVMTEMRRLVALPDNDFAVCLAGSTRCIGGHGSVHR